MKFKQGEKVRVVDSLHGHNFNIGDVVTIAGVHEDNNHGEGDYRCELGEEYWYITDDELEKVK